MPKYKSYSDEELAILLQSGDEVAFKVLYLKYWDRLFSIASKRLNDTIEAEEVVQDIFLNLWKRKSDFKLKAGFDNYFAIAVKFEVIKRRAKRLKREAISHRITTGHETIEAQNQDWHQYDFEQISKLLEKTINELPPKCRMVFELSRDDQYTNKKIAEALGISEKTVEKHITSALKVLNKKFGQKAFFLIALVGL